MPFSTKNTPRTAEDRKKISAGQQRRHRKARETSPGLPPFKRCPRCGLTKRSPRDFGMTKRRLVDGEIAWHPRSWCKSCQAEKAAAWRKRKRADGTLSDHYRRTYLARRSRHYRNEHDALPAAPLLHWLAEHYPTPEAANELAKAAGVSTRRMRSLRAGDQKNVALDTLDKLLLAAHAQHMLHVLYPPTA